MRAYSTYGYTGRRAGHYKLLRQIGQGGYANVYLGEHIHLGTLAAVKILKRPLARQWRWQFLREARIAASLRHDHILPVLDYGIFNGIPYLVMQLAPYGSLREHYRRGEAPDFTTMLDYLEQVASALEYLHARGLLHLDLKPENLLLGDDNKVLLSDFGIAEIARQQHTHGTGTPAFMAPELIDGQASAATDQYALAIIVYEWLAGRQPFHGTRDEILDQQRFDRPASICAQAGDVTPAMEQVVFRALAKDPARRYPSVQAFVAALRQATFPSATAIPPAKASILTLCIDKARQYISPLWANPDFVRHLKMWYNTIKQLIL
jgi:eukaryotic-like serine/threonine-protein kinase